MASTINIIKNYVIQFDKKKIKRGKIINIASIYGFLSPDFKIYSKGDRFSSEIYGATKSSIIQLTKYYAVLLADRNINVNCISPGPIATRLTSKVPSSYINKVVQQQIINKQCSENDILNCVKIILSPESDKITGENFIIGGF